jgi:hypothetical protein
MFLSFYEDVSQMEEWKMKEWEATDGVRSQRYQEWGENRMTERRGAMGLRMREDVYFQ